MLGLSGETEKANKLYAVEPPKLGHEAPPPSAREIVERVEFHRGMRKIVFLVFALLSSLLLLWSWLTEIDVIGEATGQLVPAYDVQPVKSLFDGKIASIDVKEGDQVKKADVLLTLDSASYATEVEKYTHELTIAERELQRHIHASSVLTNYLKNPAILSKDLSGITDVAQAIGRLYAALQQLKQAESNMKVDPLTNNHIPQMSALAYQQKHLSEERTFKRSAMDNRLKQYETEEAKLAEKISTLERQAELQRLSVVQKEAAYKNAQEQLAAYETAFKSGASSKTECLEARMRAEDKQRDLTATQANESQTAGSLETARFELAQMKSTHAVSVAQMEAGLNALSASGAQIPIQMRDAERKLLEARTAYQVALRSAQSEQINEVTEIEIHQKEVKELKDTIAAQQRLLSECTLRSPVNGIVALMHLQGPSQVIARGETLLTIVPTEETLIAEVYVPNSDIAFVKKGEQVRIQFPAYPYQQYGTISGTIDQIDDAPSDEKEHAGSYRTHVTLHRNWIICRGRKIFLKKGLGAQAQLHLRKERLLIKILAPLLKARYMHFKG